MGRRSTVVAAVVGIAVLGGAAPAFADTPYPPPDGRCVDTAGVLGAGMCARVTALLLADEKSSSDEIAVAVVPTTGGAPIESWATGLFNTWGVGKKGVDNGVLLVVAVNDHRVRIATGRGLGARLSDGQASEIVNATITPEFRAGRYPSGVLAGLDHIRRTLGHPVTPATALVGLLTASPAPTGTPASDETPAPAFSWPAYQPVTGSRQGGSSGFPGAFCAVLVVLVALGILAVAARAAGLPGFRGGRRTPYPWWSSSSSSSSSSYSSPSSWGGSSSSSDSGSSGSSGSSFGGGSSDGGGSSGSW